MSVCLPAPPSLPEREEREVQADMYVCLCLYISLPPSLPLPSLSLSQVNVRLHFPFHLAIYEQIYSLQTGTENPNGVNVINKDEIWGSYVHP